MWYNLKPIIAAIIVCFFIYLFDTGFGVNPFSILLFSIVILPVIKITLDWVEKK